MLAFLRGQAEAFPRPIALRKRPDRSFVVPIDRLEKGPGTAPRAASVLMDGRRKVA